MAPSPFMVGLGGLQKAPNKRRPERRAGPIPGLKVSGSAVPDGAEVVVDVVLELVPGGAIARGKVEAPWAGECRRCLGEATGQLSADVWEVFEEQNDPEQTYPLHGDQLDLEPMARDAVLLELPLAPLCKVGCRGLCPTCGADQNVGDCDCEQAVGDPRWAALDVLREN